MNNGSLYFPEKLHSKPVKVTNVSSKGFFTQPKQVEAFYSIKSGDWNDPSVWETVSGRVGKTPGANDDVYIKHVIIQNQTTTVNNLFVSGTLTGAVPAGYVLTVRGNLLCSGLIDYSNVSNNPQLQLHGLSNFISDYRCGSNSTIAYVRVGGEQPVLNLQYRHLYISGLGIKIAKSDVYCLGNIDIIGANGSISNGNIFELSWFNLTVDGQTNIFAGSALSKNSEGSLLFKGAFNVNQFQSGFSFSGNPNVELRGGMIYYGANGLFNPGTGVWRFTTNSQTLTIQYANLTLNNVEIVGAITLNNTTTGTYFGINNSINGTTGSSAFVNKGDFRLFTSTLPMSTGSIDVTSFANIIYYAFAGSYTLPYTNYSSLGVSSTGTKTLAADTVLSGSLILTESGTLELSSYNFTVNGTTALFGLSTLSKNGSGSILQIGNLSLQQNGVNLQFTGNPNVELRGGISLPANFFTFNSGTGTFTFTTNNQSITQVGTATGITFNCNVLISGAITLTVNRTGTGVFTTTFVKSVTGNNAFSTLDNREVINYQDASNPMVTGVLQSDAAANTFKYNKSGDQDVTGGTYRTLEFGGSGVKKLLGNVVVNTTAGGSWSITGTATIDYNGFTITTI